VGLIRIEEESIGNVCHGHMGPLHMPIALIGHLVVGLCLVVMAHFRFSLSLWFRVLGKP